LAKHAAQATSGAAAAPAAGPAAATTAVHAQITPTPVGSASLRLSHTIRWTVAICLN
jgi:hypothetical protein